MREYMEFKRKITKGGGTSTSYRITIPEEIIHKMEVESGDKITWRVYDNSNKVEIIFENNTPENTPENIDLKIRKQHKQQSNNHKKYIQGSKNKGYYIVNEEKNITIGAYTNKSNANSNVDILVEENWSKKAIETSKLNVEMDITSESYPHVRNNNPYYTLTKEEYEKLYKDTQDITPFKHISYEELQQIIQNSINTLSNIDETTQKPTKTSNKEIIQSVPTDNKEYTIELLENPYLQIRVIKNNTQKRVTYLGAKNRENSQIQKIITLLKSCTKEDEFKEKLKEYR